MKLKFDLKSIKFKIWLYFIIFAATLMIIVWCLQILFLNNYYKDMKIMETKKVAANITSQYTHGNADDLFDEIQSLSDSDDMYIQIESISDGIIFSPSQRVSHLTDSFYKELNTARQRLQESDRRSVSIIVTNSQSMKETLVYAGYLNPLAGNEVILYVLSPLYPVSSTISILQNQLVYITIIALVLAFLLSFYLSNRITKPISSITRSAKKLSEGQYGITFEGGHYTEITSLADTLTRTSFALEKSVMLQKDLMANVSHDLRTPLTMVKSYAEMVRDLSGDNPEKRNAHLQVIIDEADRLNKLVSDMLTLSRMQSGAMVLELTTFDIREVTETLVQSYGILEEQEGYRIILKCGRNPINVRGDKEKIKQVISNLLNNAVKYAGKDKKIIVTIKGSNKKVRCEVTDHGQGIAPDELKHIWQRYYKASSNHVREVSGTGLGLSIVKEILALHKARFGVSSKLGKGSTFWFELTIK